MGAFPKNSAYGDRGISPAGLAGIIALHVLVVYALLQMNVIRLPDAVPVLAVSLLTAAAPEALQPDVVLPKPRPVEKRPVQTPVPVPLPLALPATAAATVAEVPVAVPPAPTFVPLAPSTPAAPLAPPAPTQPRFDADYLDNPKPAYPPLSRRMREEGRVVLLVQVRPDGSAAEVQLHMSSGSPHLDQSALDAVRRWKFVPARLADEAVVATVLVPIVFSLKE